MDVATKKSVKQTNSLVNNLSKKLNRLNIGQNQGKSKSARKRASRRRRLRPTTTVEQSSSMRWPISTNTVISQSADTGLRRLRIAPRDGLSDEGISFLKCAFAPPDFAASSLSGVPDEYRGMSLVRKHRLVGTVTFTSAKDYFVLFLPVPGIAYFILEVDAGSPVSADSVFTPVRYSDFLTMFPSSDLSTGIVTRFRYVSNHFEIIPTVNQMTWSGQVQAWKLPLQVITRTRTDLSTTGIITITGIEGCNTTLSNQFTGPFIGGIYTACYSSSSDFEFCPVIDPAPVQIPELLLANDFGQISGLVSGPGSGWIPGFDNGFESMLIKISGVTANETCIVKTWACVEYCCNPQSALYEFNTLSPFDPVALNLYKEVISNLPVGVPFEDNESFWSRVLEWIHRISGMTAYIPGSVGSISRGTNLISGALLPFTR